MGFFSRAKAAAPDTEPAVPKVTAKYNFDALFGAPTVPNLPTDGRVFAKPAPGKGGGGEPAVQASESGIDAIDTFRKAAAGERLMIALAAGISGTAAFMSVSGFVGMVPGAPTTTMVLCYLIEGIKFVGAGVLSAGWRSYGWFSRTTFGIGLLVAALITASGVYGFLITNHTGPAAERNAVYVDRDSGEGSKLEIAQNKVRNLEKQIDLIDAAAQAAAKRAKDARAAKSAIDVGATKRAPLEKEREAAEADVAHLKAGRTSMAAHHQADEAAALPIRASAALFEDFHLLSPGTDPDKLWRWIVFLVLLTGDPLALAAMFMVNSRYRAKRRAA